MAIGAGRATTSLRYFKAPLLQTERTINEGPSEKLTFNWEQFENLQPKSKKIQSSYGEQKKRTTRRQGQKLNMNHVAKKKLNEAKLKKAFRMKLFELCRTRTKKLSPDLFNFYVTSAGHDMANDAGRATRCWCNFKAPWLQTERTKNEGPSEKMRFNWEQFENFKLKIQKIQSSYGEQNKRTTRPRGQKPNMNHVAKKKLNEAKLKKAFRMKLFELCRTRTKKSSPDLFNFYLTSAVMTWPMTLAGLPRASAISKLQDYKHNVQIMKGVLKNRVLTGNSLKTSSQKTKKSSHRMENKTKGPQDPERKNLTWTI